MKITAIMHVRNEELYIERCIEHLIKQGIDIVIIDNESSDRTLEICRTYYPDNVILIDSVPFDGFFDLRALLVRLHQIRRELDSDWIVYQGVDEMLESNVVGESLRDAIVRIDSMGYNIINFDEFVFVPTDEQTNHEDRDYYNEMRRYYFFEPMPNRLMRAYNNNLEIDCINAAGHFFSGDSVRQYHENLMLRHYICLSMAHFREKYGTRKFSKEDLERGWHHNRAGIDTSTVLPPSRVCLHEIKSTDKSVLRTDYPMRRHFWEPSE